jgi:hypothetical protein
MDLTMEEFQRLADDKSQQAMRVAELERELAVKTAENAQLRADLDEARVARAAAKLENMILRNYITLSVEKIKSFVRQLKGIERFAFLKTFLEYVLPQERYQEQLLLVNEVMAMPNENTPMTISHADVVVGVAEDGSTVFHHNLEKDGREQESGIAEGHV